LKWSLWLLLGLPKLIGELTHPDIIMDFNQFRALKEASFKGFSNSSEQQITFTELPSTVLEAFIPGYRLISQFILSLFGFDISVVVSIGILLFALFTAVQYAWRRFSALFSRYFMSSVYIDEDDEIFENVIGWIATQRVSKVSRSVKAVSDRGSNFGYGLEEESEAEDSLDDDGIFNFAKWAAKTKPRFEPYFGTHQFWHEGRLFFLNRSRREVNNSNPWQRRSEEQMITLTTIGRSTQPIKNLLHQIKIWALNKDKSKTVIRRPAPKDRQRYSGSWARVSTRPSRPMDTVVLDYRQKELVVADINEYLHPSSPRWYATRGIPYRRGYLFHGPPGTGKTSLSFALAGIFGLDIYVVSLLEGQLTESDLNHLFNSLPRRCIVLLEDIDSAGLLRDEKSDKAGTTDTDASDSKEENKIIATDIAKAIKDGKSDASKDRISLSGLLNAIDGVASHEGRILVMTTNYPEKLDDALIRPGRVDMQVKFGLASHLQIREIFLRMYSNHKDKPAQSGADDSIAFINKSMNGAAKGNRVDSGISTPISPSGASPFTPGGLEKIADEFANRLPENRVSPAEVQGFLLTRKKEPLRALEEVEKWRDALLEAKEKKVKVLSVQ
jgi:mitochondrial chaperone BCS1